MSNPLEQFNQFNKESIEEEKIKKEEGDDALLGELSLGNEKKTQSLEDIENMVEENEQIRAIKNTEEEKVKKTREIVRKTTGAMKEAIKARPKLKEELKKDDNAKNMLRPSILEIKEGKERIKSMSERLFEQEETIKGLKEKLKSDIDMAYLSLTSIDPEYKTIVKNAEEIMAQKSRYENIVSNVFILDKRLNANAVFFDKEYEYENEKRGTVPISSKEEEYNIADNTVKYSGTPGGMAVLKDMTLLSEIKKAEMELKEFEDKMDIKKKEIESIPKSFFEGKDGLEKRKRDLEKIRYGQYQSGYTKLYEKERFFKNMEYEVTSGYGEYELENMKERGVVLPSEYHRILNEIDGNWYPLTKEDFYDPSKEYTYKSLLESIKVTAEKKRDEVKLTGKQKEIFTIVQVIENIKKQLEQLK